MRRICPMCYGTRDEEGIVKHSYFCVFAELERQIRADRAAKPSPKPKDDRHDDDGGELNIVPLRPLPKPGGEAVMPPLPVEVIEPERLALPRPDGSPK